MCVGVCVLAYVYMSVYKWFHLKNEEYEECKICFISHFKTNEI